MPSAIYLQVSAFYAFHEKWSDDREQPRSAAELRDRLEERRETALQTLHMERAPADPGVVTAILFPSGKPNSQDFLFVCFDYCRATAYVMGHTRMKYSMYEAYSGDDRHLRDAWDIISEEMFSWTTVTSEHINVLSVGWTVVSTFSLGPCVRN